MKRFTDTEKWKDPWFRRLEPRMKLLWIYLCDQCDNAGVFKPDVELASFLIGQDIQSEDALKVFDGRVSVLPNGDWWLPKFVFFQFGKLNQDCRPHQSVMHLLERHRIDYSKGIYTLKDKDKDKDKEKDKEGSAEGEHPKPIELPTHLRTARMGHKWIEWVNCRRALKKPKSWVVMFNEQIEWLSKFSEPEAFEILSASIRNGWQGLFPPKNPPINGHPVQKQMPLAANGQQNI